MNSIENNEDNYSTRRNDSNNSMIMSRVAIIRLPMLKAISAHNGRTRLHLAHLGCLALAIVSLTALVLVAQVECAPKIHQVVNRRLESDGEILATGYQQQQQSQPRPIDRIRRQASSSKSIELNEQTMKPQLPDLIAQAHQDKSAERALLRMLINASLRSGLDGNGNGNAAANSRPLPANWQFDPDSSLVDTGESVPARSLRLEQAGGSQQQDYNSNAPLDMVDLSSLMASINQLTAEHLQPLDQPIGQLPYPVMDKREYIKPCSFNAISCVRTPFRKF